MNLRQIVAKNTLLQIVLQGITLLAGFYSISLIARYLGKGGFGKYSFVSAFYFFFIMFLDFGTSQITLREVSQKKEKAGLILGNLVTFKFILSSILVFIALIITNILPFPKDVRLILCIFSPALLFVALESIQAILQANLRYEYIALASFLWRIASLLLVILSIRFNLGLAAIVFSFVLAELLKFLVILKACRNFVKIKFPLFDTKLWMDVIKASLPLGVASVLVAVIRNLDVMLLTRLKGFSVVGLYSAPYKLCDTSLILPLALMGSIFPLMSRYCQEDRALLKKIYQKTFDVLSPCAILLVVLVLSLADKIILLVLGPQYIDSVAAFRLLIFPTFFVYLAIGPASLLIATNNQKANMRFYLLAAALNIVLNLCLIPRFSFIGAAVSSAVTMFLIAALTFYFVQVRLKIPLKTIKLKKSFIAGLCTAAILFFLKDVSLFISAATATLFYVFLVIFWKAIDREDIMSLFGLVGKFIH